MGAGLREAQIPEDAVGLVVLRLSDGAPVLAHREKESMQPASTLKLLTSLVALETLGPAYRARTHLRVAGEIVDGVVKGDLVLQGGGDVDFDWMSLERMLDSLRLRGVREIAGDVILDLSRFQPARTDVGLPPFDEEPEFRYNVIPDALLLNAYLLRIDMVSRDKVVAMKATPALDGVSLLSEFDLVDRPCDDWEDGWKTPVVTRDRQDRVTIRLRGEFPRDCSATTEINVIDRVEYADRLVRALWSRMGGKLGGRVREGKGPAESKEIAEHLSRPLAEIMRDINKRSDNPITRVVYLTLGMSGASEAAARTADRSELVVHAWLAKHGVDPAGLLLDNGSGLSRTERIRPDQLAAVLKAGASSRWAPEFVSTLPIVGIDGAMRNRLKDSAATARARIKTGTLRNVSAVAGYVDDSKGRTHIVVAMINHDKAVRKVARPILDTLLDWVARQ
jgi:D-alanyl-D-alanine carboxypeptidase/D-alanyl-D-alanine-endopeptidase (penicillin-binding protein 4)